MADGDVGGTRRAEIGREIGQRQGVVFDVDGVGVGGWRQMWRCCFSTGDGAGSRKIKKLGRRDDTRCYIFQTKKHRVEEMLQESGMVLRSPPTGTS